MAVRSDSGPVRSDSGAAGRDLKKNRRNVCKRTVFTAISRRLQATGRWWARIRLVPPNNDDIKDSFVFHRTWRVAWPAKTMLGRRNEEKQSHFFRGKIKAGNPQKSVFENIIYWNSTSRFDSNTVSSHRIGSAPFLSNGHNSSCNDWSTIIENLRGEMNQTNHSMNPWRADEIFFFEMSQNGIEFSESFQLTFWFVNIWFYLVESNGVAFCYRVSWNLVSQIISFVLIDWFTISRLILPIPISSHLHLVEHFFRLQVGFDGDRCEWIFFSQRKEA